MSLKNRSKLCAGYGPPPEPLIGASEDYARAKVREQAVKIEDLERLVQRIETRVKAWSASTYSRQILALIAEGRKS